MIRRAACLFVCAAACGSGGGGGGDDGGVDVDAPVGPSEEVHLIGRFDTSDASAIRFAWPGSTIMTRFDGTDLALDLSEDGSGGNYFDVDVDGVRQPVVHTTGGRHSYPIAAGLAAGMHDVVIARRTESFFGASTFHGFTGAPLVATPRPGRLIEMVGDSITCGYGVLGAGPSCSFSADTEAETHAWGALAAAELGVPHTAIAYSGKGVIRNNGGDTTDLMPALYQRTFADEPALHWNMALYHPDVIVVDLGTNDFAQGDPGPGFVTGYRAFVADLRADHPDAWIVIAMSPMLSDGFPQGAMQRTKAQAYLDQVVSGAGDPKVVSLAIAEQSGALGCDYHPGPTTQQAMADALAARVRELTHWP